MVADFDDPLFATLTTPNQQLGAAVANEAVCDPQGRNLTNSQSGINRQLDNQPVADGLLLSLGDPEGAELLRFPQQLAQFFF
jgi:hypothetical protein